MRKNLDKLEEIAYKIGNLLLLKDPEIYSKYVQIDPLTELDLHLTNNFEELIEYLGKEVSEKTLSPIAVQQIFGMRFYTPQKINIIAEDVNTNRNKYLEIISAFTKNSLQFKTAVVFSKNNLINSNLYTADGYIHSFTILKFMSIFNPENPAWWYEEKFGVGIKSVFDVFNMYESLEENIIKVDIGGDELPALKLFFIYIKIRDAIGDYRKNWEHVLLTIANSGYGRIFKDLNRPTKLKIPRISNNQILEDFEFFFPKMVDIVYFIH